MKQARVGAELNQTQMAEILGCSVATYRAWEKHPERMKISTAQKFCDAVGVCIEEIFFSSKVEFK